MGTHKVAFGLYGLVGKTKLYIVPPVADELSVFGPQLRCQDRRPAGRVGPLRRGRVRLGQREIDDVRTISIDDDVAVQARAHIIFTTALAGTDGV
jgi:hypothetical protein